MIYVCARRCLKASRAVVGAVPCLPPDDVPVSRVRLKKETLDGPVTSVGVEEPCETAGRLNRSRSGLDGKQSTHGLDNARIQDEPGHTTDVEMARIEG